MVRISAFFEMFGLRSQRVFQELNDPAKNSRAIDSLMVDRKTVTFPYLRTPPPPTHGSRSPFFIVPICQDRTDSTPRSRRTENNEGGFSGNDG